MQHSAVHAVCPVRVSADLVAGEAQGPSVDQRVTDSALARAWEPFTTTCRSSEALQQNIDRQAEFRSFLHAHADARSSFAEAMPPLAQCESEAVSMPLPAPPLLLPAVCAPGLQASCQLRVQAISCC